MHFQTIDTTIPEEARVISHDFEVEGQRLTSERDVLIPDKKGIFRIDTNQYLGTVGINWEPVQPSVLYDMAHELLNATQETNSKINGVLNLHNGSVIGISFKLADREYVDNDRIDLGFILLTAFNGMYGLSGNALSYRHATESTANTSSKVFNLKHTKFVGNRIEVVKDLLKYYNREISSFDAVMNRLVTKPMNRERAIDWFKSLFPRPRTRRSESILETSVNRFSGLLDEQRDNQVPGVYGTSYGAWCALTQYVNHHRVMRIHNGRDEDEVRFQTVNFGTGNTLIQKGMSSLSESFVFTEEEFTIN